MSSEKAVFIIPGYRQTPRNKAYQAVSALFRQAGFTPIPVAIVWKNSTISENTQQFLKTYNKLDFKQKYIFGFSFGAMIALLAATKVSVNGVILCSLSPYFSEDIVDQKPKFLSPLQADRRQDFLSLKNKALAKKLRGQQIMFLYGTKEARALINRVRQTYRNISSKQKELFPVRGSDHVIGDKVYLQTLSQVSQLLV